MINENKKNRISNKRNVLGPKIINELENAGRKWVCSWELVWNLNRKYALRLKEEDLVEGSTEEVVVAPRGPWMSGEMGTTFILSKYLSQEKIKKYRDPETYRSHDRFTPNKFLDRGIYSHKIKGAVFN